MKAWITGARGFIGSHLARHLSADGWTVGGLDVAGWDGVNGEFSFRHSGGVSLRSLENLGAVHGLPDAIFHLAGGSSVGASLAEPLRDFENTVGTTAALMEDVRKTCPGTSVVCVSSGAVYGPGHAGPIPESARPAPCSPYGHHKLMMETLCRSYAQAFELRIAIVRPFSVYGPGLRKQLLWDLCERLRRSETPIELGGHGGERRDWLHVTDVARLLAMSARLAGPSCPVVNGGTGVGTTVREVTRMVADIWGSRAPICFSGVKRAGDPESMVADTSVASALGFAPRIPLLEGIQETVRHYKSQLDGR